MPGWYLWAAGVRAVFGIEGDVWLHNNAGLFHSTNSGASFTQIANVDAAYKIAFGKSATTGGYPAVYMVGNVSGVYGFYRSINGGASWTRINDDAHQSGSINALAADPNIYGRIYLGTAGRGIIYGDNLSTLPVSLVSFNAKLKETNLAMMGTLNWQTTSEKDFSHFIVERSTNGSNWLAIGKVNGAGTASLTNYTYDDDISLIYGDIFYRLKMEDKDGEGCI